MLVWVVLVLAAAASVQGESERASPLIKIGSTYYMPLYKLNDLEAAASISSGRISQRAVSGGYGERVPSSSAPIPTGGYPNTPSTSTAPKRGYAYVPPSTRLPPLAEQNPPSPSEEELESNAPSAVSPDREAELPTTPDPIGLEFEQEIESVGISAAPPRPVTDTPGFEINEEYGVKIPGVAGVDYPNYASVPRTNFRCSDYEYSGYFGDVDARCQSFHVCLRRTPQSSPQKWSFLCPNGTIFNQRDYICSWWHQTSTPCKDSPALYPLNKDINWEEVTERSMKRIIQSQTGVFRGDVSAQLLQVQRSQLAKTANSKSRTTAETKKSESEAYADKSIGAAGFIVNRRPSKLNPSVKPVKASGKSPAAVLNPNGQTIPNTPPRSVYGPPSYVPPEPTYLPPRTTTPSPGIEFDPDSLDPEETDQAPPNSKPEVGFETTTVVPITKPKPKLNYLPPKAYLPPGSTAPTFRSKNSDTINKILATSNIVDQLDDNEAFQGFSGLGTKSQFFNSNIRELLKGNRVQEINPGFLELDASPNGASLLEPVKAFLSSQGQLSDQQRLEIHQFDKMALFVPSDSQGNIKRQKFPYVQPSRPFPTVQPQPIVLQAAAPVVTSKSLLQGAPISHAVSQAQVSYAAPPQQRPVPQPQASFQPLQLPRQPLIVGQQPQVVRPTAQPVTRVQQFVLNPTSVVQKQQPIQNFRQALQQPVLYSAPQQQVGPSFDGQLIRAQSFSLPEQNPLVYLPSRDQSSQPSVRRPFLIEPTDQPEIIPSITIHSSTIVTRGRGPGVQGGYGGGYQQASGSTNSVSLLRPATHSSKANFFNKFITPNYSSQSQSYNAVRPAPKYVIPPSALRQTKKPVVAYNHYRQNQYQQSPAHYNENTTPKPVWTDYKYPTERPTLPSPGRFRIPVHNSSSRHVYESSRGYGFKQYNRI